VTTETRHASLSAILRGVRIPTSVVGSHAHPGWLDVAVAAADRGEVGEADVRETLDDAVDVAIRDMEDAGIDVVTDGEMRRAGFFTAEFYRHIPGLAAVAHERRLGAPGHDQQHRFRASELLSAPRGLGVVEEYRLARERTTRPLKVTLPGPFTLAGRIDIEEGGVYPNRMAVAEAFVPLLRDEIAGLADAGARWIQIDEPSTAIRPEASTSFADLFNHSVAPARDAGARVGVHLCFGNYLGRPLARRSYRPILDQALRFDADELVLEFANREMAELDIAADVTAAGRDLAAGVIDVKSYPLETPDDVAARIERLLEAGVAEDRLLVVPDCGFSQTARWATKPKLRALVAGRDLVIGRT